MAARYQIGDVVRTTIPGVDLTKPQRPAVVLADLGDDDVIVALITKVGPRSEYDIPIKEWQAAGLTLPCFARVNKPVTTQKARVEVAGKLTAADRAQLKTALSKFWTSALK